MPGLEALADVDEVSDVAVNGGACPTAAASGTWHPNQHEHGQGDSRVPVLLLTGLTAFLSAGLRRHVREEAATSYSLNDGTMVEFDANGRFITPSWSDPSMATANSVHIFPAPQITADNPSLKDKGLPPTIEGGITFPSNPNDQMYLLRVPGPEGDNHNWYVAYTYMDPRLDDPGAKDKDGWLPYALIVQDQNGYHQVTDPPAKGSAAAAAMAAGLAMWGFQRPAPGTQGGTGRGGGGRGGVEENKPPSTKPDKPPRLPDVEDPKKFDPNSLYGKNSDDVAKGIPPDWTSRPSKTGGGTVYNDPNNKGRQIRIMPGYTQGNRPDPLTHGPYAEVSQNGSTTKVPLEGNPTLEKK
ncbi:hypothetical protein [Nocardia brasiliensis]|uniref:hypothetical protein n=1 Tax=Nocardia brasiliensis TaxID=37326 RepID=UPI0033C58155